MKLLDDSFQSLYKKREVFSSTSELIKKYTSGKYVLDVGCANWLTDIGVVHGEILNNCSRVVGIDINENIHTFANNSKAKYIHANAETYIFDEKFDVIFVGDVIEHLSNPGLFLANAKKMMHNNSLIILITANPFGLRNFATMLYNFEPLSHYEHVFYHSVANMNELVSRFGFTISNLVYITGQHFNKRDKKRRMVYKVAYKMLTKIGLFHKFIDTYAVICTPDVN